MKDRQVMKTEKKKGKRKRDKRVKNQREIIKTETERDWTKGNRPGAKTSARRKMSGGHK